jgi:hypothetical protein
MAGLGEELEAVEEEAGRRGARLRLRLRLIAALEARYQRLQPIAARRRRAGQPGAPGDAADIDELLRQVQQGEGAAEEEKRAEIQAVALANVGLEAQIAKLQKEIDVGIAGLTAERNRLGQQIERQRGLLSIREKEIVDQMHELRLKIAQKRRR